MSGKVLSVGQCRPDNAAIGHFLKSNFEVEVLTADLPADCMQTLASETVDLVLINRKLDPITATGWRSCEPYELTTH